MQRVDGSIPFVPAGGRPLDAMPPAFRGTVTPPPVVC
jgi:hypothetical protein